MTMSSLPVVAAKGEDRYHVIAKLGQSLAQGSTKLQRLPQAARLPFGRLFVDGSNGTVD